MKKHVLLPALAAALLLGLCACGPKTEQGPGPVSVPPATEKPSEAPVETPSEEPTAAPTEEPSEAPSAPPIFVPGGPGPQMPGDADDTVLPPSGVGEGDTDLHFFMDELFPTISEYEFPAMDLMSDERLIHEYPGLGAVPVKQRLIYTPMMTGVACEFAFVEVEDEADVETVKAILQQRIDSQIDGGAFYPAMIEQWENNARIFTGGKYVILAVHEMSESMAAEDGDFATALGFG